MTLATYVVRRFLLAVPTFLLTSVLIFSLIHLAPGNPIDIMFAQTGHPPSVEVVEELKDRLGINRPIYEQYFMWLIRFGKGDLGTTYSGRMIGQQVSRVIITHIPRTLELMLSSVMVSIIVSVVLGVISAVRKYSLTDTILSIVSIFGYSMPTFWIGLLLIFTFGVRFGLFPTFGAQTVGINFTPIGAIIDNLWHLFLPVLCVSTMYTAYLFRLVRSSMIEVLNLEYVTTARAKGVKEWTVIYKHALKNVLLPVVTFIGLSIGFVLGGSVITESVFGWPGLGKLTVYFATSRDYNALMGVSMTITVFVILANLCTDIAYAFIDPRIKY